MRDPPPPRRPPHAPPHAVAHGGDARARGVTAAATDIARCHPDAARRAKSQAFVELMIPIVKAWSTDNAIEIASIGIQVHGGAGFIEETGAAQFLRDARIASIYEGTNGIQALDLIGRKVARDKGETIRAVIAEMREVEGAAREGEGRDPLRDRGTAPRRRRRARAGGAVRGRELRSGLPEAWWARCPSSSSSARSRAAGSRAAPRSRRGGGSRRAATAPGFYRGKLQSARFYADHVLVRAGGLHGPSCPARTRRSRSRTTSSDGRRGGVAGRDGGPRRRLHAGRPRRAGGTRRAARRSSA